MKGLLGLFAARDGFVSRHGQSCGVFGPRAGVFSQSKFLGDGLLFPFDFIAGFVEFLEQVFELLAHLRGFGLGQ